MTDLTERRTNMVMYTLEQRWEVSLRSTYRRCQFWKKKIISSGETHKTHKTSKIIAIGAQKTRTHTSKNRYTQRSHCLVRVLVQRHNLAIFLGKWASRGRYSQLRSLSGHVEWIFVHKNWRAGYRQHLVSTGRRYVAHSGSYTRCFTPCFWRSHYQAQSGCCLATSELRFDIVGLIFVRCRQR